MHQVANEITVPVASVTTVAAINGGDSTFHFTPSTYLIFIQGKDGKELAHIKPDGTVITSYPGAEEPAAKAFWGALQSYGTSIVTRLRELEARLAKYEPVEPFVL